MRGIWSQVVTLAVIVQIALVSGKALLQQNQQAQQGVEQKSQNENVAQKRVGYDYPAPPDGLVNPYQEDHEHVEEHHDHHEHHDPGYWKKKLIWKPGWKKIWKQGKKQVWKPSWKMYWKQIWVPEWKDIWLPGVKKIWRPVWISEWFPSPDHHEHVHKSGHGWDRSDNNAAGSQKSEVAAPQQLSPKQSQSAGQYSK